MSTLKRNYYGLDLSKINEKFTGDLTYLGDISTKEGAFTRVYSVFKAANPDRSQGHKEYVMIYHDAVSMKYYVTGREENQLGSLAKMEGIKCLECGEVLVSLDRHDYQSCKCENSASIDGGRDYIKRGAKDLSKVAFVEINLLTGEVSDVK
jgi:hypothetical protein